MHVLCFVILVLEDKPFRLYASFLPTVQSTEAKVVEDAFHAKIVLCLYVVFDGRGVNGTVGNVLVRIP